LSSDDLDVLLQTSKHTLNAMVTYEGNVIFRLIDLSHANGDALSYEKGVIAISKGGVSRTDNTLFSLILSNVSVDISCTQK